MVYFTKEVYDGFLNIVRDLLKYIITMSISHSRMHLTGIEIVENFIYSGLEIKKKFTKLYC